MESCLAGGGMNMAHVGMGPNRMSCRHVTLHHYRVVVAPPTVWSVQELAPPLHSYINTYLQNQLEINLLV